MKCVCSDDTGAAKTAVLRTSSSAGPIMSSAVALHAGTVPQNGIQLLLGCASAPSAPPPLLEPPTAALPPSPATPLMLLLLLLPLLLLLLMLLLSNAAVTATAAVAAAAAGQKVLVEGQMARASACATIAGPMQASRARHLRHRPEPRPPSRLREPRRYAAFMAAAVAPIARAAARAAFGTPPADAACNT